MVDANADRTPAESAALRVKGSDIYLEEVPRF